MRRMLAAVASLLVVCANALAQGYPTKPVHVVVPYPPGGGADVVVRVIAAKMGDVLGQNVIVDNRAGAGGNIGTDFVSKAPADGYTFLVATASTAINQTLTKNKSWDALRDFAPVVHLVFNQNVVCVHPSVPVHSIKELIAYAKANPGKLTYASYGNGSSAHLITEYFKLTTGVNMLHVPYKGAAPAVNDVVGGQVNVIFADIAAILSHIKAGRVRALGVGSAKRFAGLPDVPTVAESGLPGWSAGGFLGLVAPTGTPQEAIAAVNAAALKALAMPDVLQRIEGLAAIPVGGTPEEFGAFLKADVDRYAKVITAGNIKAQ